MSPAYGNSRFRQSTVGANSGLDYYTLMQVEMARDNALQGKNVQLLVDWPGGSRTYLDPHVSRDALDDVVTHGGFIAGWVVIGEPGVWRALSRGKQTSSLPQTQASQAPIQRVTPIDVLVGAVVAWAFDEHPLWITRHLEPHGLTMKSELDLMREGVLVCLDQLPQSDPTHIGPSPSPATSAASPAPFADSCTSSLKTQVWLGWMEATQPMRQAILAVVAMFAQLKQRK